MACPAGRTEPAPILTFSLVCRFRSTENNCSDGWTPSPVVINARFLHICRSYDVLIMGSSFIIKKLGAGTLGKVPAKIKEMMRSRAVNDK